MKVSGALMNMILVIISAFVANVAADAQLSTELEQSYSVTSQQAVKATAKTADLEQLSALNSAKVQKIFCSDDFKLFPCNKRIIFLVDYQTKLAVEFKTAKNTFVNINNKTSLLPLFTSIISDESPS